MCLIGGIFNASLLVGGSVGASPLLANVGMVSMRKVWCSLRLVSSFHFV